jgi:hypothetical protein
VDVDELEHMAHVSLRRAREFDINPDDLMAHLAIVRERLK